MPEKEPPMLNIHQRIHAIMSEVAYIQKGEKQVDGKYRFVSHDQVAEVIHAACVKHHIVIVPEVTESTVEIFDSKSVDRNSQPTIKTAYFAKVKVALTFVNIDAPDDVFISKGWPGTGIDPQDKAVGKAVSYAVKYGLLKVFMLETGDDPDNEQTVEYTREVAKPKPIEPPVGLPSPAELSAEIQAAKTVTALGDIAKKYKAPLKQLEREDVIGFAQVTGMLTKRKGEIMNTELNDEIPEF